MLSPPETSLPIFVEIVTSTLYVSPDDTIMSKSEGSLHTKVCVYVVEEFTEECGTVLMGALGIIVPGLVAVACIVIDREPE